MRAERLSLAAGALALAGLGGCYVEVPDPIYTPCAALGSSDWSAQTIDIPPPEWPEKKLPGVLVTGKVTLPTGGYTVELDKGPISRVDPPVQQMILRTTPPARAAIQALTTETVRGVAPLHARVKSVEIRCGDGTIARIPTIRPMD